MLDQLRPAVVMTVLFTLLLGLAYPLAITGIAGATMPAQAGGGLVSRNGVTVGSALIGQTFASARYFWPRPSATGPDPYNAASSSGSNLGPTSAKLRDRVAGDVSRVHESGIAGPLPADAVTASGSGIDPHISPDFARLQAPRVARARGLSTDDLLRLVAQSTEGRLFGFIGEPRVNVLRLNLALDALKN